MKRVFIGIAWGLLFLGACGIISIGTAGIGSWSSLAFGQELPLPPPSPLERICYSVDGSVFMGEFGEKHDSANHADCFNPSEGPEIIDDVLFLGPGGRVGEVAFFFFPASPEKTYAKNERGSEEVQRTHCSGVNIWIENSDPFLNSFGYACLSKTDFPAIAVAAIGDWGIASYFQPSAGGVCAGLAQ
jgi:hypothetical protein